MNYDDNIYAEVVFDGAATTTPKRMGVPNPDQLHGTQHERLVELAGRVCYDSLGKGRSSAAYHAHIAEVGHGSVWEHANFTVQVDGIHDEAALDFMASLVNRPGVWVDMDFIGDCLRVTLNLRAAYEWDTQGAPQHCHALGAIIKTAAHTIAPQIVTSPGDPADIDPYQFRIDSNGSSEERWISLLLGGSRGMSHEQVRHKFRTAVSQRSTRYVDEAEGHWVDHPLVTKFLRPSIDGAGRKHPASVTAGEGQHAARTAYAQVCGVLEAKLLSEGIDKHTSRKQARGAARGFLGNALHTEMIFSASVAQWRRMIAQRGTRHADAEIRVLYSKVLTALRTTCWKADFSDLKLKPSPDGIGQIIVSEPAGDDEE